MLTGFIQPAEITTPRARRVQEETTPDTRGWSDKSRKGGREQPVVNAVTLVFAHRVFLNVLLIQLEEVNALRFRELSFVFLVFEWKDGEEWK